MRCRASIFVLLLAGALAAAVPPSASSNDLVVARRALGDGLWQIAEKRALAAESVPSLRGEARLVQIEALARAGRDQDVLTRLDVWGQPDAEAFRYWRAFSLVRLGRGAEARPLLERPFSDAAYASLAVRLLARLAVEAGDAKAAEAQFARVAEMLAKDPSGRAENALEWARARDGFGDAKAALEILKKEDALETAGAMGDEVRLFAAELMDRTEDSASAIKLRERLVAGGEKTAAPVFVAASVELSRSLWQAGDTNVALVVASNAVRRAVRPDLERLAGYALGFKELAVKSLHTNGIARISSLVRAYPDAPESHAALFRLGDELLLAGEAEVALREYDRLLSAYPQYALDARVFERRGWAFHALKKYTEAVGAFARAAQITTNATDRARYVFKQADELLASGRYDEAADMYGRVEGSELASTARFQRADALARAGKDEESRAVFKEIFKASGPFAVDAGLRLASAEAAIGRTENAIAAYNRILGEEARELTAEEVAPQIVRKLPSPTGIQRVEALYGRGRAFYRVYRFAEAEKDFSAVAELRPSRTGEMRFLKALCRYGAGRDDEAHEAALALLKDTPDSPLRADLVLWLAKFDYARRDYATARAGFEAYAANTNATPVRCLEALVRAARCAAAQTDHPRAVELVSRVVAKAGDPATASADVVATLVDGLLVQSESLMEQARFDEAVLVLERVMGLSPSKEARRRAAVLKADCLFAMGADNSKRYQEALGAYRAVLQDEDLPPSTRLTVAFKIGRALEKLRRFEEADDQYYTNVVLAYCDSVRSKVWFDANARAFFARAVFILADRYEAAGLETQAADVLGYLVATGVPAAEEASRRIARLKRKGGFR